MNRSLLFIAFMISALMSCENDANKVQAMFEKKLGVDKAINIESYMSQGGLMRAKLTAPVMYRYQDTSSRIELPNTLHVDFYDSTAHVESKLDAQYARYYESDNKIFLRDNVRVYNLTGDTLFCKELWWDQRIQKFFTEKAVRIHTKDMIMYGEGLSAPVSYTHLTLPTNREV